MIAADAQYELQQHPISNESPIMLDIVGIVLLLTIFAVIGLLIYELLK